MALSQQWIKGDTTTTLTTSPLAGDSVALTATIAAVGPAAGTPTGTVKFFDNGSSLGSSTLNASGLATLTATIPSDGQHIVKATYVGDGTFNGSTQSRLYGTDGVVFTFVGSAQDFEVPAGVNEITATVMGARGGGPSGGAGGKATATLAVTPGTLLTVTVGGAGADFDCAGDPGLGGFNGGADGGPGSWESDICGGSGGGGASDIEIGGSTVLAAGGGGGDCGDGDCTGGGGGGLVGGNGTGGAGGGPGGNQDGTTGSRLRGVGSKGSPPIPFFNLPGGGGGGGYYGGRGGAAGGGGGGGSGFGPAGTVFGVASDASSRDGMVTLSFSVAKTAQTITFPAPPSRTFGDAPFTLSASASSGLPVSYSVTGPCSVSGSTVTITGAGACNVTASQSGNATYAAATPVSRSVAIAKADQTITFPDPADRAYGDAPFALTGTASSGLAVSYSVTGPCSVSGSTVTITGAGTCNITASQAGNTNYNAATSVSRSVSIAKDDQTITFPAPASHTYGDAPFALSATASSGLTVTYAVAGPCSVANAMLTITGSGTCNITANQAGNTDYNAAAPVSRSVSIAKAAQTITFPDPGPHDYDDVLFSLSATASSGLAVGYSVPVGAPCSVSGSTVTILGAGTCVITASQPGNTNYNAATPVSRSVVIAKAAQTITFPAPASHTYGDAPFALSATASSGLPVSYSVTGPCSVSGSTVTITGAGACNVTASQPGNANYNAATPVSRSVTIAKANQTITFAAPGAHGIGDSFDPGATSTSGLPVSYSVAGACSVSGSTVTITAAGPCDITASQAGNANYNAATPVTRSVAIAKSNQTITFPDPADRTGMATRRSRSPPRRARALPFAYTAGPSTVCTVSGATVTITGVGLCNVTAFQDGDDDWNAATPVARGVGIDKANQTIAFPDPGPHNYNDVVFSLGATASSGLPVTYSVSSPCSASGSTVTITGAGTCNITAFQSGDALYNAAEPVQRFVTIAKAPQTITFADPGPHTVGDSFDPGATSSSGLPVSYAVTGVVFGIRLDGHDHRGRRL